MSLRRDPGRVIEAALAVGAALFGEAHYDTLRATKSGSYSILLLLKILRVWKVQGTI